MQKQIIMLFALMALGLSVLSCQAPSSEADVEAIQGVQNDYVAAVNNGDVDGWLATLADDAVVFPPYHPQLTGKEAIRTHYSQVVESPGFVISAETTNVGISSAGDLAYSAGTSEETINDPDGNPVTERGKWVSILKKQPDGTWKSVLDIWNSDGSAASE